MWTSWICQESSSAVCVCLTGWWWAAAATRAELDLTEVKFCRTTALHHLHNSNLHTSSVIWRRCRVNMASWSGCVLSRAPRRTSAQTLLHHNAASSGLLKKYSSVKVSFIVSDILTVCVWLTFTQTGVTSDPPPASVMLIMRGAHSHAASSASH